MKGVTRMPSPEIICLHLTDGDAGLREQEPGLTDAVLGLEDLVVVLSILDLCPRLPLIPVVLTAGAATLTL